jgi:hypothetical protein
MPSRCALGDWSKFVADHVFRLSMAAMTTGAMAGMVVAAAISVAAVTPEAMGPDMVATWFGPAKSRVPPLYPLTRASEGRADMSAVGQQRDPLVVAEESGAAHLGFGGAMLLDLPGPARRLLTDVADFHFSDIPVRGDDGARAIGATDDAAAVELPGRRRRQPCSKAALTHLTLFAALTRARETSADSSEL